MEFYWYIILLIYFGTLSFDLNENELFLSDGELLKKYFKQLLKNFSKLL